MEVLKPSQMFVVPIDWRDWVVWRIRGLLALVVGVRGRAILALVLKGTNAISSPSSINSTIVLIECLTKSNRLNP